MNKKLEKYINYIVDDMVSNTEIDHKEELIYYPFPLPSLFSFLSFPPFPPSFLSSPDLSSSFSRYVIERYGVKNTEIEIIFDHYKKRIESLIKK